MIVIFFFLKAIINANKRSKSYKNANDMKRFKVMLNINKITYKIMKLWNNALFKK